MSSKARLTHLVALAGFICTPYAYYQSHKEMELFPTVALRRAQTEGLRSQRIQPGPFLIGSLCSFLFPNSWSKVNRLGLVTDKSL